MNTTFNASVHIICTDPNFVVSSDRDHAKEAFKAHTSMDRMVSVCGGEGGCECGCGCGSGCGCG